LDVGIDVRAVGGGATGVAKDFVGGTDAETTVVLDGEIDVGTVGDGATGVATTAAGGTGADTVVVAGGNCCSPFCGVGAEDDWS
jgi:hypothetical protein